MTLMAACSMVIALVPSRDSIPGWPPPSVLIVCRLVQRLRDGRRYGVGDIYMSRGGDTEPRIPLPRSSMLTLVGGHVLAQFTLLIILTVLPTDQVHEFRWRIGFAVGGLAAVVVFWMRRTMDESLSPEQLAAVKSGQDPAASSLRELLTHDRRRCCAS